MAESEARLRTPRSGDAWTASSPLERIRHVLAGRPVVRVGDLWEELGRDRYAHLDTPVERVHIVRLLEAGYWPVPVLVLSRTHKMYLFVRGAWASDENAPPVRPGQQYRKGSTLMEDDAELEPDPGSVCD